MATPSKDRDFSNITNLHLSRLLPLGFDKKRRPVDQLVERLSAEDGAAWLRSQSEAHELTRDGLLWRVVAGEASLDAIEKLKQDGNLLVKSPRDRDELLFAMALYFVSIAAALVHHGKLISSQKKDRLDGIFTDLAPVIEESVGQLLDRAVQTTLH